MTVVAVVANTRNDLGQLEAWKHFGKVNQSLTQIFTNFSFISFDTPNITNIVNKMFPGKVHN